MVLTPGLSERAAPVVTSPEDRWVLPSSSIGRFSVGMATVLVLSLALHAILVGIAYLNVGPAVTAPEEAVAVEVVQDIPKPPPVDLKPALPGEPAPGEAKTEAAPPPKSAPEKTEAPKEPAKPEPAKPEPAKSEAKPQSKQEAAPKPADPPKEAEDESTLKSLESQVEALKAEQAALEAEHETAAQPPVAPAALPAPGQVDMGPLPDSFRAIALPATSDGAGEAVGYQQIVFSQLAKANEIGKIQGMPGSSGVHFDIDEAGRLVSVEVVAPSGVPSLDAMALTIVRKAAPFPPPPQGAQRSFTANVTFTGEGRR